VKASGIGGVGGDHGGGGAGEQAVGPIAQGTGLWKEVGKEKVVEGDHRGEWAEDAEEQGEEVDGWAHVVSACLVLDVGE
jgi:hypothetical protein